MEKAGTIFVKKMMKKKKKAKEEEKEETTNKKKVTKRAGEGRVGETVRNKK